MNLVKKNNSLVFGTLLILGLAVSVSHANLVNTNSNRNLPETQALERELNLTQQALASTTARLKRLQSAARSGRKKAEEVSSMIKQIRTVEDQIGRLEKELNSLSKIPQLKMLKPLVSSLKSLKGQVNKIRVKADKVRKEKIDPAIKKIRDFEADVSKVASQVKAAEMETIAAKKQLSQMKSYVAANGYKNYHVSALEAFSQTAKYAAMPMRKALGEIDSNSADAESKINSYAKALSAVAKLKSGVAKIKSDLAPIDKKARDLDRVLSKRISFKIPFKKKKVSFTVRQVIESPGKIIGIAVKPLTAIAKKLLSPLTKKFKINIKAPSELREIEAKLASLQNKVLNLDRAQNKFRQDAKSQAIGKYRTAMIKLKSMTSSRLGR